MPATSNFGYMFQVTMTAALQTVKGLNKTPLIAQAPTRQRKVG
jgi:hypothetical protein